MSTNEELYSIFVHKRTQVEMMKDRGYLVSDKEQKMISSFDSFKDGYKVNEEETVYKHKNPKRQVAHVLFTDLNQKITAAELFKEYPKDHHIIISKEPLAVTEFEIPTISVEFFEKSFFVINPFRHILNDPIVVMSPLEEEIFFATTGYRKEKLPGISINDARVRYMNYSKNSVIKEFRKEIVNVYLKESSYYRVIRDIPILYETKGQKLDEDEEGDEEEQEEDEEFEEEEELEKPSLEQEEVA